MTIGLKVIGRKRALMVHMRVKRQHQRWTLLHEPHARMATAMEPTLVTFGPLEPTFQIQIICGAICHLPTYKQPWLKAAHHRGEMLVHGVSACPPRLLQRDERCLTLLPGGLVAWPEGAVHSLQVLDISPYVRQGYTYDLQATVNATGQTRQQRFGRPPFFARRLRSSESRTSCNASLIRKPGG